MPCTKNLNGESLMPLGCFSAKLGERQLQQVILSRVQRKPEKKKKKDNSNDDDDDDTKSV